MTSFSLKGILLQYGGFLVAMLAVAITVVSPRSEALFGISTTTCLLIGAFIVVVFVLSLFLLLSFDLELEFASSSPQTTRVLIQCISSKSPPEEN